MIVLLILSLFSGRRYSWILLLVLLAGFKNISAVFAFHFPQKKFQQEKRAGCFRLLSWNVNSFIDCRLVNDTPGNPCSRILDFIRKSNADIVCLQDFSTFNGPGFRSTFDYLKDSLGYRYTYFPVSEVYKTSYSRERYGTPVFSRYPLSDTGRVPFIQPELKKESLVYATVNINGVSFRVFNTHLLSMNIHTRNGRVAGDSFLQSDTALMFHTSTFRKLKQFDKSHVQQAEQIKAVLNKSGLPFVFCADINSVPSSYTYHHLSKGLTDAFLATGFGLGRTYDSMSSSLRIDVVLMSKLLRPVQHHTSHIHVSDHLPNITDIEIR
jgi:endonuclease/exonuclease/phosphatase family metal-dependent hydrolase